MLASIPARRIADVDDIADAVLFLSSDAARHVMGQALTVDGGEGFLGTMQRKRPGSGRP